MRIMDEFILIIMTLNKNKNNMKRIKLTESQLHNALLKSIRKTLAESIHADKLMDLAKQHGGIKYSDYKNGSGNGSPFKGGLNEIPDDCVLGTGKTDLHVYPHDDFEINGISSDEMDQIKCNDGEYIYIKRDFQTPEMKNKFSGRKENEKIPDGAFLYNSSNSKKIRGKRSKQNGIYKKINDIENKMVSVMKTIMELEDTDIPYNITDDIYTAYNAMYRLLKKLNDYNDNITDNLTNAYSDNSHYWRPLQPSNVSKTMKARDSRLPNRGGRTDTYYDVQGGGIWGHGNSHKDMRNRGTYK